jgi:hypothetical protein
MPHMIEVIARNLGGLELTRATGALSDEWEPGIGNTLLRARADRLHMLPYEDDDLPSIPPPFPPDLPEEG